MVKKYISVDGYEGHLELDALTERVLELVKKNFEFNEEERSYGKRIANRINYIYEKSSEQQKSSNYFTLFLSILREFNFFRITASTYWCSYFESETFDFYTLNQFKNAFGCSPHEAKQKGYSLGTWTGGLNPDRWCVNSAPS